MLKLIGAIGLGEFLIYFAAIVLGIAITIALAIWPGQIARRRGHESASAITICGWIGIFFWPLWLVGLVWAFTGPDRSKVGGYPSPARDPRQGFPMDPIPQNWSQDRDADVVASIATSIPPQTDGPGRYRVEGVDKETKMDTTWYCVAASAANAKVKAQLTGIIVTSITRES